MKEMPPKIDIEHRPSEEYKANVNASLGAGPFRARTNANGFLETGNEDIDNSRQLFFLGDSFVESLYVPENMRFTSIVERNLTALGAAHVCRNGGYSGSTSLNLFNVLVNKIFPLAGPNDWVILFVPQSDADSILKPETYWGDNKRSSPVLPGFKPSREMPFQGVESTRMVLKLILSTAKHLGLNVALAASPFNPANYEADHALQKLYRDKEHLARVRSVREGINSTVQQVCLEFKVPFIEVKMSSAFGYFYDELHLNEDGQRFFAEALAPQLRGILNR